MRPLFVICIAFAMSATGAAPAVSQDLVNQVVFTVEGGVGFPTGDLSKSFNRGGLNAETGFHGAVGIEQMFGRSTAIGLYGRYHRFGIDEMGFGDVSLKAWVVDLSVRGFVGHNRTRPFVVAGMLLGRPSIVGEATFIPFAPGLGGGKGSLDIEWSFGFHAGGGMLHMVSEGLGVFAAGEYLMLQTVDKSIDAKINGQTIKGITEVEGNAEAFSLRFGINKFFGGRN